MEDSEIDRIEETLREYRGRDGALGPWDQGLRLIAELRRVRSASVDTIDKLHTDLRASTHELLEARSRLSAFRAVLHDDPLPLIALYDNAIRQRDDARQLTADLVRRYPHAFHDVPPIVCLCGSTRFYDAFQTWNYNLTMAGRIVLSVGFYSHVSERAHGESIGATPEQKIALDELHKRKIDIADRVLVLNVNGYVGESTRSEIAYAWRRGKPVDYLERTGDAHDHDCNAYVLYARCLICGAEVTTT
jgi:hypothetical protein